MLVIVPRRHMKVAPVGLEQQCTFQSVLSLDAHVVVRHLNDNLWLSVRAVGVRGVRLRVTYFFWRLQAIVSTHVACIHVKTVCVGSRS